MNMLAFVGADILDCSRHGEKRATKLAQDVKQEGWDVHMRRHCPLSQDKGYALEEVSPRTRNRAMGTVSVADSGPLSASLTPKNTPTLLIRCCFSSLSLLS